VIDVYGLRSIILYTLTGLSVDGKETVEPNVIDEAAQEINDAALRELVK